MYKRQVITLHALHQIRRDQTLIDHHDHHDLENVLIVQEVIDRNAMANLNRDVLAKMAKNVHFPAQIDQIAIRVVPVIVQVLNRDLRDLAIVH